MLNKLERTTLISRLNLEREKHLPYFHHVATGGIITHTRTHTDAHLHTHTENPVTLTLSKVQIYKQQFLATCATCYCWLRRVVARIAIKWATSHATHLSVWNRGNLLWKVEAESTLCNLLQQLATEKFVAREVVQWVLIRVARSFKLQATWCTTIQYNTI